MLTFYDVSVIGTALRESVHRSRHSLAEITEREYRCGPDRIDQHLAAFYEQRYADAVTAYDHLMAV